VGREKKSATSFRKLSGGDSNNQIFNRHMAGNGKGSSTLGGFKTGGGAEEGR